MSRGNVDRWRASIEDIRADIRASGDEFDGEAMISKMAQLWAAEIEWDVSAAETLDASGVYRGVEGARRWWREWLSAWETLRFDYELVDAGDRVVWLLDLRMRGRSTGIEVARGKHAWVATFSNGLIVHQKLYQSQSEALEAAGPEG
jgi:hypothetical protein